MTELPLGNQNEKETNLSGGLKSFPLNNAIDPKKLGVVKLNPTGEFEAGSYQTFEWIYTAGTFGIDDSGSIRICFSGVPNACITSL